MSEKQKVRPPHPHPKWTTERTIKEYLDKHYPMPLGMTNAQWVLKNFPRKKDESWEAWFLRLAEEPILAFLLEDLPNFVCDMGDPYFAPLGRILMPVLNMNGLRERSDLIGFFMDRRIQRLKDIGYLFDQNEERRGRYGFSMGVKNATHYGLLKLGIDSRLVLNLQGNSFFHSNTVIPRLDLVPDVHHPFYQEHSKGPWTLMVTSHLVNKYWIACTEGQFGPIRLPPDATQEYLDKRVYEFKWQHYKSLLHATLDKDNCLVLRACTNPELMFRRGLVEREAEDFEWVYREDRMMDEKTGRNVPYMKLTKKPLPTPLIIREYLAHLDEQTWAPIHLLNKLKGFDPSKIRPEK